MNKLKLMQKQVGMASGIALAALVVTGGIMAFTGSLAGSAATRKAEADSNRNQAQSQLQSMQAQIEKSGDAERSFLDIQRAHSDPDYAASSEAIKDWLRAAKAQYRFSDTFKLTLALEKKSERGEFSGMNFDIMVREPMKLELDAISDTHVFSFIDGMLREAPGFVRISKMDMQRKSDMSMNAYRYMLTGAGVDFVKAQLEFSWIGVQAKEIPAPAGGTP